MGNTKQQLNCDGVSRGICFATYTTEMKPIKPNNSMVQLQQLKSSLQHVRQESLMATRQGDYRRVAKLTTEAATLNKAILETQGALADN